MRIGLQISKFTYSGGRIRATLRAIAETAEQGGFDSLWVMDHFFQIEYVGPPEMEMLEAYATLGYLAGLTDRIALGALVTGVVYRYPGILVKTATTIDVLSGGRCYFGIGAAWFEREARGLGVPFPQTSIRFEQLEEALQIAHQMWSHNDGPFAGKHFQLAETLCSPPPIRRPHPPILIGGLGEKKTLRLVARYGDACNLFDRLGWDVIRHKLEVLRRHCDDADRPYDEIEKTTLGTVSPAMTSDQILAHCRKAADLGIQHMIFNFPDVDEIDPLDRFARKVIPAAREMGP